MMLNTETTKLDRLRMIIGIILGVAGLITLTVVGAFFEYNNLLVWGGGFGLLLLAVLIARSERVAQLLYDLLIP